MQNVSFFILNVLEANGMFKNKPLEVDFKRPANYIVFALFLNLIPPKKYKSPLLHATLISPQKNPLFRPAGQLNIKDS